MKKSVFAIALFLGSITLSNAQDNKKAATPPTPPPAPVQAPAPPAENTSLAEIKFEKMVHDYGTMKQGANSDIEFSFVNTGKEPLIISNCQGSCGCTVPQCPKDPILPGKSSVIKVHYDSNRVGPINKQVFVYSNAKGGMVTLAIKGNVEALPPAPEFGGEKKAGAPFEKN